MIEAVGRVVAVESGIAWVEAERKPACGHCAVNARCGTSVLAKLFASRPSRVRVEDTLGVTVGDAVIVGIREEALLYASILVYGVPLLALGAVAVSAASFGLGDALCALAGFIGFVGGLILTRRATARGNVNRYAPVLLARHNERDLRGALTGAMLQSRDAGEE
jgi:sigma-E factor negative regulatory protein RseC